MFEKAVFIVFLLGFGTCASVRVRLHTNAIAIAPIALLLLPTDDGREGTKIEKEKKENYYNKTKRSK